MRQPYRSLFLVLAFAGVATAAVGVVLLSVAKGVNAEAEVGKWLLTVAAGLLLTGALSMVVRQIDQRRVERDAWHAILNDLVAANQSVTLARLRLAAHRSVLTYANQLAEILGARVELRRLCALGTVIADSPLRERIEKMRTYLDDLGSEYESRYLRVARQQRLDEVWLTRQIKQVAESAEPPALRGLLAEPTKGWRDLQNQEQFPRLAAFLDSNTYQVDAFRANYKIAKSLLEERSGIPSRSLDARLDSARKLRDRTKFFLSQRGQGLPDELSAALSDRLADLESAISKADPGEIDAATLLLNEVTRQAINKVYPSNS